MWCTSEIPREGAFFGSSAPTGVFSANKLSCKLSVFCTSLLPLINLLRSVLNSNSVKISRSLSSSDCSIFSSSQFSSIGTSVRMVAKNFDILISSTAASTFSLSFPFIWLVCSSILSIDPNWLISFAAVFSPTPGQPGKLSAVSPISANRSIT